MRIRGVALYANLNKGGHERLPCEQRGVWPAGDPGSTVRANGTLRSPQVSSPDQAG